MPTNTIQQTIQAGIDKIKKQKNQIVFDKLCKDYSAANSKYHMLLGKGNNKLNATEARQASEKEKAKIEDLVKKMQKLPELYKPYEPAFKYDIKARENALNIHDIKQLDKEYTTMLSDKTLLTNSIVKQNNFIDLASQEITKLSSMIKTQPEEDARIKAEYIQQKEILRKERDQVIVLHNSSKDNNPVGQKKLIEINTKIAHHEDQHRRFLNSMSGDLNKTNQDHFDFNITQVKDAQNKIKTYEDQLKTINIGTEKVLAKKTELTRNIATFNEEIPVLTLPKHTTVTEKIRAIIQKSPPKSKTKETSKSTLEEVASDMKQHVYLKPQKSRSEVVIGNHRKQTTPSLPTR